MAPVKTEPPAQRPLDKEPIELWVNDAADYRLPTHLRDLAIQIKKRDLEEFGRDESGGKTVQVAAVLAPKTEKQLSDILRCFSCHKKPLTIASANTGLSRGAVPSRDDEEVLSMRSFTPFTPTIEKETTGKHFAVVAAGMSLKAVQELVEVHGLLYPPDPTEQSALIGATAATNASGARTFKYGPTRGWIRALRVMLADGEILNLRRGEAAAGKDGRFKIQMLDGSRRIVRIPTYKMPAVKNTAGYYARPGMDLIDLFIGSEGTLGVITQVELDLIGKPAFRYSGNVYFTSEADARAFVVTVRNSTEVAATLLEYYDKACVDIIREKFGRINDAARAAIYFEQEMQSREERLIEAWHKIMADHNALDIQEAFTDSEREKLREQRHSVPEEVHRRIAAINRQYPSAEIAESASDIAVPCEKFEDLMSFYEQSFAKAQISYAIWGHIGNSHVHAVTIPQNPAQHEIAKQLLLDFARKAKELGGTITAEHGTGKLKVPQLEILFGRRAIRQMAAVKRTLDPSGILGRGSIFKEV